MNVSIVIPVYNEAADLGACLSAIAAQTVAPYEVIVVDNNSTDNTAAVAQSFDFVRLLREPKQGVVHARSRGFDAARGDIIARIDAETIIPPQWLDQLQAIFSASNVAAVSGAPHYYDFPLSAVADALDRPLRAQWARHLTQANFLSGGNMGLRRRAWEDVRRDLCNSTNLHEDFDLGIHLQERGFKVIYDATLIAGISCRRIDSPFLSFMRYTLASPRTYAHHGLRSRYYMYPALFICWMFHLPARLIYRAYNPHTKAYSFSQLLSAGTSRVGPRTNIV